MSVTQTATRSGRIRRRVRHLPAGLLGCGVALVASLVVAGVTRGTPGALGAAVGVVGVAVSYVLSGLAVAWADAISPQLTMPVGLTTYAVKVVLLGVVLVGYGGSTWPGLHPMAYAIIAAVVAWNVAHFWWVTHAKIPYVEIEPQ
jgi:ATP synthase protein I